jgi:uncharacterized protein (TIGR02300 family)
LAKPEWGTKRTCQACGARFYDLRRQTIVCPICEAVFDPERQPKLKRGGAAAKEAPAIASAANSATASDAVIDQGASSENPSDAEDLDIEDAATGEDDDLENADDENNDLIEDTSDLGEDDDDIGEVMEHVNDDKDENI